MLDAKDLFKRAKAVMGRKQCLISTPELAEYIGASINTPMGEGRIRGCVFAYTRRVANKPYKLYTLTIDIDTKEYHITTYEHTQWCISVLASTNNHG